MLPGTCDSDGNRFSITSAAGNAGGFLTILPRYIEYFATTSATAVMITCAVENIRGATSTDTITATIRWRYQ